MLNSLTFGESATVTGLVNGELSPLIYDDLEADLYPVPMLLIHFYNIGMFSGLPRF